jgi:hypothetical protein
MMPPASPDAIQGIPSPVTTNPYNPTNDPSLEILHELFREIQKPLIKHLSESSVDDCKTRGADFAEAGS